MVDMVIIVHISILIDLPKILSTWNILVDENQIVRKRRADYSVREGYVMLQVYIIIDIPPQVRDICVDRV